MARLVFCNLLSARCFSLILLLHRNQAELSKYGMVCVRGFCLSKGLYLEEGKLFVCSYLFLYILLRCVTFAPVGQYLQACAQRSPLWLDSHYHDVSSTHRSICVANRADGVRTRGPKFGGFVWASGLVGVFYHVPISMTFQSGFVMLIRVLPHIGLTGRGISSEFHGWGFYWHVYIDRAKDSCSFSGICIPGILL